MYKIKAIDPLDKSIRKRLTEQGLFIEETDQPQGIFVRSSVVSSSYITQELLAISRGGIGVNTIDVPACTENGTAVFNTPGVNANAVKELALTCLLLCVRPVYQAMAAVQGLRGEDILTQAEKIRPDFISEELFGKTVGIIGLGTIGKQVAEACYHLGMVVLGYDKVSQKSSSYLRQMAHLPDLLAASDYVILFLPLTSETKHIIGEEELSYLKETAVLLNFGRGQLVDDYALLENLKNQPKQRYISDFPSEELLHHPQIFLTPHIGGTTSRALEDGTKLALRNLRVYLLYGTVTSSVNFPRVQLKFEAPLRFTLYYRNRSGIFSQITRCINENQLEIDVMASERRGDFVYTLIDIEEADQSKANIAVRELASLTGMIRVRSLVNPDQSSDPVDLRNGSQ